MSVNATIFYDAFITRSESIVPTYTRLCLQWVKAVKDTAGPSGLVPTLLLFGILPLIGVVPKDLPEHKDRMKAMHTACNEMAIIYQQHRLNTALRCSITSAAAEYKIGDEVLMYREKPIGKWIGPYVIGHKVDKMLSLDTGDRLIRASVYKDKPHLHHDCRDNNNDRNGSHTQSPSTTPVSKNISTVLQITPPTLKQMKCWISPNILTT